MTLQEELDRFIENWNGTHVTKYADFLTYKVVHGFSKSASYRANQLIEELGLNLTAEANGFPFDTFIIKSKDNEKSKGKE